MWLHGVVRSFLRAALLAAQVAVAVQISNTDINPVPGRPFTITWINADGAVSIAPERDITGIQRTLVIARDLPPEAGEYVWDVPTDLEPSDRYFFVIRDESGSINSSILFRIDGRLDSTPTRSPVVTRTSTTSPPGATSSPEEPTATSSGDTAESSRRSSEEISDTSSTSPGEQPESTGSNAPAGSTVSSADAGQASETQSSGSNGGGGGGGSNATTIGVAVGVSLGVVGILCLLGGLWFYRKSKRSKAMMRAGRPDASHPSQAELGGPEAGGAHAAFNAKRAAEIGGSPVTELHATTHGHEMSGVKGVQPPLAELSAEDYRAR